MDYYYCITKEERSEAIANINFLEEKIEILKKKIYIDDENRKDVNSIFLEKTKNKIRRLEMSIKTINYYFSL